MGLKWGVAAAAIAVAMSVSGPAMADITGIAFLSGNRLYDICKSEEKSEEVGFMNLCKTYIAAISDAAGGAKDIYGCSVCVATSVSIDQEKDVVMRFLASRPAWRDRFTAANLVAFALHEAWPCPKN